MSKYTTLAQTTIVLKERIDSGEASPMHLAEMLINCARLQRACFEIAMQNLDETYLASACEAGNYIELYAERLQYILKGVLTLDSTCNRSGPL